MHIASEQTKLWKPGNLVKCRSSVTESKTVPHMYVINWLKKKKVAGESNFLNYMQKDGFWHVFKGVSRECI